MTNKVNIEMSVLNKTGFFVVYRMTAVATTDSRSFVRVTACAALNCTPWSMVNARKACPQMDVSV